MANMTLLADFRSVVFGATVSQIHIRLKNVHCIPHHLRRLDHLRQEHLSFSEQFSDSLHAGHQRPFYDSHCTAEFLQSLPYVCFKSTCPTFYKSVLKSEGDRGEILRLRSAPLRMRMCFARSGMTVGKHSGSLINEPLGSLRLSVENHILNAFQQLRIYLVIYLQH